ncbi:MAG: hypothetical protein Fur002_23690 [Anaerolineales bacterium]
MMTHKRFFLQLSLILAGALFLSLALTLRPQPAAAQTSTPTPDRLAQPTLPAEPTQADKGAQVYWLACLPCHGDKGQGLTEEFIQTYPEEDHNCWASGCHGERPYENGFKIPRTIPAVIGAGTLEKFSTAAALRSYIYAAMPYWKPGNLTEEESWQVTAFLLRENARWDGRVELNAENAAALHIVTPTPTPPALPSAAPSFFMPLAALAALLLLAWLYFSAKRILR